MHSKEIVSRDLEADLARQCLTSRQATIRQLSKACDTFKNKNFRSLDSKWSLDTIFTGKMRHATIFGL